MVNSINLNCQPLSNRLAFGNHEAKNANVKKIEETSQKFAENIVSPATVLLGMGVAGVLATKKLGPGAAKLMQKLCEGSVKFVAEKLVQRAELQQVKAVAKKGLNGIRLLAASNLHPHPASVSSEGQFAAKVAKKTAKIQSGIETATKLLVGTTAAVAAGSKADTIEKGVDFLAAGGELADTN